MEVQHLRISKIKLSCQKMLNKLGRRMAVTCVSSSTNALETLISRFINTGAPWQAGIGLTSIDVMLTEFASVSSWAGAHKVIKWSAADSIILARVGWAEVLYGTSITLKSCKSKKKKKGPIFLFHSQLMCIPNEPEVCIVQKLQISKNDN